MSSFPPSLCTCQVPILCLYTVIFSCPLQFTCRNAHISCDAEPRLSNIHVPKVKTSRSSSCLSISASLPVCVVKQQLLPQCGSKPNLQVAPKPALEAVHTTEPVLHSISQISCSISVFSAFIIQVTLHTSLNSQ